jgi:hypothetical protein
VWQLLRQDSISWLIIPRHSAVQGVLQWILQVSLVVTDDCYSSLSESYKSHSEAT